MPRKIVPALLALVGAAALLAACGTPGTGNTPTPGLTSNGSDAGTGGSGIGESRQVSGFTGVRLATSGNLLISHTGTESLTIEAEAAILPKLTSDVVDGKLVLGVKSNERVVTNQPITYRLTVKDLTSIAAAGSGDATDTELTGDKIAIEVDGSGSVTTGGTVGEQTVQVAGSGNYKGEALTTKTATVAVAGSGDATVKVSDKLVADVSGSGSITYLGDPALTKNVRGSGDITKG